MSYFSMTSYSVSITMTPDTVNALAQDGAYLYGCMAVKDAAPSGLPLVWYQNQQYSASTYISWSDQYQAFATDYESPFQGVIRPSSSQTITLGQTLNVSSNGLTSVSNEGQTNVITVQNNVSTLYGCGLSPLQQNSSGTSVYYPCCVFPLSGNGGIQTFAPADQVFLFFSSDAMPIGTVLDPSYTNALRPIPGGTAGRRHTGSQAGLVDAMFTSGILIDLSEDTVPESNTVSCDVSYDYSTSWSWTDGSVTAQTLPVNSSIIPYLIISS